MIASLNNGNRLFALTAKGSRVLHSLKLTAVPSLEISNAANRRFLKYSQSLEPSGAKSEGMYSGEGGWATLSSGRKDSTSVLCVHCCKAQQASGNFFPVLLKNVPKICEYSITERLIFCNATNTDLNRHQKSHWEFHPFAVETWCL